MRPHPRVARSWSLMIALRAILGWLLRVVFSVIIGVRFWLLLGLFWPLANPLCWVYGSLWGVSACYLARLLCAWDRVRHGAGGFLSLFPRSCSLGSYLFAMSDTCFDEMHMQAWKDANVASFQKQQLAVCFVISHACFTCLLGFGGPVAI